MLGAVASFGIGNLTQINTIAKTINTAIGGFVPLSDSTQFTIAIIVGCICALVAPSSAARSVRKLSSAAASALPSGPR